MQYLGYVCFWRYLLSYIILTGHLMQKWCLEYLQGVLILLSLLSRTVLASMASWSRETLLYVFVIVTFHSVN